MNETKLKTEYYQRGFERGRNIASWQDLPEIGETLPRHVDWVGIGTVENIDDAAEAFTAMVGDAEENDRSFSPFEFTAHEINSLPEFDSETAWEAFDEGIHDGISAEWEARAADYYKTDSEA